LFSLKDVVPFHENQAVLCGELRTATRSAGLSLGDRAGIALATTLEAQVVTADRAWAKLSRPCRVHLFR
jgi:ribonuclease VapC